MLCYVGIAGYIKGSAAEESQTSKITLLQSDDQTELGSCKAHDEDHLCNSSFERENNGEKKKRLLKLSPLLRDIYRKARDLLEGRGIESVFKSPHTPDTRGRGFKHKGFACFFFVAPT